jgi:hypothetical protein
MNPRSPTRPRPGWSASLAPNRRIMAWPPSCGPFLRGRGFVGDSAQAAGFDRLANAGKSTVWRILDENDIKPHRIRDDLEKRDPQFDRKMQEVLMVYREVSIYSQGAAHDARPNPIYTVSVDEKPGVQAIGLTAPGSAARARQGLCRRARLRIRSPRHGLDTGRHRPARGPHLRQRRGPAPQRGVHRSAQALGRVTIRSEAIIRSRAGQPLGPYLQGDHSLLWPLAQGASSTFTRPSMALGSI